ncbi:retrovirus-related pol polyprotein from transposon TNT 1-94 [Tanacetum coccineum]|uniref:Retrovirus-related pol polyprotein from transposon TNT 1-94 n=1 Tax=Tanacetum coccineum TaxID=301880 RepID=A0ABQ5DFT6_9ASTR
MDFQSICGMNMETYLYEQASEFNEHGSASSTGRENCLLNGELNEVVYVVKPEGFVVPRSIIACCTDSRKLLYGLKQSSKVVYDKLSAFLIKHRLVCWSSKKKNKEKYCHLPLRKMNTSPYPDAVTQNTLDEILNTRTKDLRSSKFDVLDNHISLLLYACNSVQLSRSKHIDYPVTNFIIKSS